MEGQGAHCGVYSGPAGIGQGHPRRCVRLKDVVEPLQARRDYEMVVISRRLHVAIRHLHRPRSFTIDCYILYIYMGPLGLLESNGPDDPSNRAPEFLATTISTSKISVG